jgi:hypothetical protein
MFFKALNMFLVSVIMTCFEKSLCKKKKIDFSPCNVSKLLKWLMAWIS